MRLQVLSISRATDLHRTSYGQIEHQHLGRQRNGSTGLCHLVAKSAELVQQLSISLKLLLKLINRTNALTLSFFLSVCLSVGRSFVRSFFLYVFLSSLFLSFFYIFLYFVLSFFLPPSLPFPSLPFPSLLFSSLFFLLFSFPPLPRLFGRISWGELPEGTVQLTLTLQAGGSQVPQLCL